MSMTRSQVDLDLDQLPRMPLTRLRALWAEQIGKAKPPVQKRLLIRELAWRLQERVHGGLAAETTRLLQSAMRAVGRARQERDSDARAAEASTPRTHPTPRTHTPPTATTHTSEVAMTSEPGGAGARRSSPSTRSPRPRAQPAPLPPSSRLVRIWGGVAHEVTVLDGGTRYRYRDKEYRSLSEIARLITGTHWSGPRFFGTTASRPAPHIPHTPHTTSDRRTT